ncbi:hypothetical protein ACKWTF_001494 [Chironomus riparius]
MLSIHSSLLFYFYKFLFHAQLFHAPFFCSIKMCCLKNSLLFITIPIFFSSTAAEHPNETNSYIQDRDIPKFGEPIQNQTIAVGREAVFSCVVDNLQTYKIAWLKVDTQTILSIQTHIITKNHRMTVSHVENRAWVLRIRDVKESDKGWYMCQINTDPMKNQVGYLNVVVPPDILDYPTSTDMVVREGSNVTLKCAARGSPQPNITWRREGGESIAISGQREVVTFNGSILNISRVNRLHMGAYLCIASNGIPPTVSKRVMLIVHFPPMLMIQNQLVGSAIGQKIMLECQSEAYPKSINYWMKNETIITKGKRFEPVETENAYKVIMKLTINSVGQNDFGAYKCVSKNSLGDTDGTIKLYHHRHQSESISSTEVQKMKENEIASSTSRLSSQTLAALIYSLLCYCCLQIYLH